MSFREWLKDLWLDIRYGRWEVERVLLLETYQDDELSLGLIKQEGCEICYDPAMRYMYLACHKRSGDKVMCANKREAEGVIAIHNDSRGLEDVNPNGC